MRYSKIVQPSAWQIQGDADLKEAAVGELRRVGEETNGDWGARRVHIRPVGFAILPRRKTYLIGSHVGGIYSPNVRYSAGESVPATDRNQPLFKGPTDDCRCLLPMLSSDGSSGVAMVTSASPEFRTVM